MGKHLQNSEADSTYVTLLGDVSLSGKKTFTGGGVKAPVNLEPVAVRPTSLVDGDVEHKSTTQVTIQFTNAPVNNKYRVVIFG